MDTTEITEETTKEVNAFLQQLQNHSPSLINMGIKVVVSLVVFFVGRILINWFRRIVRKAFERSKIDVGVAQFIDSLLKIVLYVLLIISIATNLGVDTASVAAVIASAGVAIGLALQGSLSNFAGGVLILLLKPFVVGDYIIEDTCKNEGTVKEIQLFYTKLTTIDNRTIVIPNGTLANNSLTNVTDKDERRLDLKIGISYEADLKEAKKIIAKLLEKEARIRTDKEILIFVDELAASAVVLGVRAWVKTEDFWDVKWKFLEDVKQEMDSAGIEIPYQQVAVHMCQPTEK
ncbi:mechanosensitive ion channel [Dorea acetigenes]|uniref:Mechanosensitive ion channel n=1 Tax=Dorea acetigenes TaxID=2981787 RepID=A0ABT2RJN9_9FIRM|nr:mechanosensitive ion channel domain-containing protein [Dorea acetigenes]MCB6413941.1 mechanosensitive ion channel [Faecalimonas umbilicata]MCU6685616.1 mechanosensitive ion channel [Dorea acetigenes]SCI57478.1 Small-conductance mechanosensitive channel [uncultured Clostridium sp.]